MKKLICVLVLLCLLPVFAHAEVPSINLDSLTAQQLLQLWLEAGERLKELGAYPYIELSKGDSGIDITNAQTRLVELYYYTSDLTGKYDDRTIKAVKAWEKTQDIKSDGKLSIDEQNLLYSAEALPKATPTPKPADTPAPTSVPDHVALEITEVNVKDRHNIKTLSIKLQNHSDATIDAFTIVYKPFNRYGEQLKGLLGLNDIYTAEWWKELAIKPGKSFSMGSYYWYLDDQTTVSVQVAISKYHSTDGVTVEIAPKDYIWFDSSDQ